MRVSVLAHWQEGGDPTFIEVSSPEGSEDIWLNGATALLLTKDTARRLGFYLMAFAGPEPNPFNEPPF